MNTMVYDNFREETAQKIYLYLLNENKTHFCVSSKKLAKRAVEMTDDLIDELHENIKL